MLYFEDIEVGKVTRFGSYAVTRDEVLEFARKYDPQPFHLSDEAAAKTHFGRLAASGWHTCAMTMAMVVEQGKIQPMASLGAAGVDDLKWLRPVYPGDTLRCETEVLEKRESASKPTMGLLRQQTSVFNQDEVAVMRFTATVMAARRPA